ncbi:MAG: fumarylacetoacetate hydrolase family protein [Anaerovoracaceae bacterium]|jgi:2-keto-4-pentenoate hydratase/2-oxohepta-3-ene-1,7-dioic acid hydratase in catechol pathway
MIYATINQNGKEKISCIDRVGNRVFLLEDFFSSDVEELNITSNQVKNVPETMNQFIAGYQDQWTDDIALFFGCNPELSKPLEEVQILAPIPVPTRNILCLGKNYADHAKEIHGMTGGPAEVPKRPIYFTKATHTVIGTGQNILAHEEVTKKIDYEVELGIVIGRGGINIRPEDAENHIFGYTIGNDISARDLQTEHVQWYKGKSLTTHCPLGPWIVHKSVLPLPLDLEIKSYVNGELRQDGNTKDLIFDIPTIISDLSQGYELHPGDIILTGTPAGVGMGFNPPKFLKPGDEVCCMIENIGSLINVVQ